MKVLFRILLGLLLLLVGGLTWLWFSIFELAPDWAIELRPRSASHQFELAERFLEQNKVDLTLTPRLTVSDGNNELAGQQVVLLPSGTLTLSPLQRQALQNWVKQGGVLIMSPAKAPRLEHEDNAATGHEASDESEQQADSAESDEQLLADQFFAMQLADDEHERLDLSDAQVGLPLIDYPLHYFTRTRQPWLNAPVNSWFGSSAEDSLRGYQYGRGWLIAVDSIDQWSNDRLVRNDNAELLLRLAQLYGVQCPLGWNADTEPNKDKANAAPRACQRQGELPRLNLLVLQSVNDTPWYQLLWRYASNWLLAAAALLLLWLWRSAVRFGPLLDDAPQARRALLEHVDACARWLWHQPKGRDVLVEQCRATLQQRIAVRHPELSLLPPQARIARLAAKINLPEAQLNATLMGPIPEHPVAFSQLMARLQTLRTKL